MQEDEDTYKHTLDVTRKFTGNPIKKQGQSNTAYANLLTLSQ